jgi:SSS family solute:Na+ symporter
MNHLPVADLIIIGVYLFAMIFTGLWFSRKSKNADQFTRASGSIPGWAAGISIYATFLSSNSFLGIPGKAFGSNWNSFVFSLSMPIAAWIAARYFIPFYRNSQEISAYTHLESRFGPWARTYAVACFLLTQLARMGSVFLGIALSLQALTGFSMSSIMIVIGFTIIIYTMMGGIEAVIWTEVIQAVIKTLGAILLLYLIIRNVPGGWHQIVEIGMRDKKFSLGSLRPEFDKPTFWVVFLYGIFINLSNFGVDKNYIQRYKTTTSEKDAIKSLWLCVKLYLPVSLLFFIIGTSLYAYYQLHPELESIIKVRTAGELLPSGSSINKLSAYALTLKPADYGDKALPEFMVKILPVGIAGLIISAILSAAMSTISSSINASATVFTYDIYKRYINSSKRDNQTLRTLYRSTAFFGVLGIIAGISLIGVKSILDAWWQLSGTFTGGMLGLFLLGIISRSTRNIEAKIAVLIGVLFLIWMTFPRIIPNQYAALRSTMNTQMTIVICTLSVFLSGMLITSLRKLLGHSLK